jgi:hypothetical protein
MMHIVTQAACILHIVNPTACEAKPRRHRYLLTSGPFGDSLTAAARPKRLGVSRQAKGREFDSTMVELFTLLT